MNEIQIQISGDSTLEKNVLQAQKIETSITNAYESFKKMSGGVSDEAINDFKKLTAEAEKYKNAIVESLAKEKLFAAENQKNSNDIVNELKKREQARKEFDTAEKNRLSQEKMDLEKLKTTMNGYFKEKEMNQKKELELNKKTVQAAKEVTVENQKNNIERQKLVRTVKSQAQNELDLITIEKKQITTLNDLKERVSALKRVRDGLDTTNEKGVQEFKRLTAEINRYNNALKSADEKAGFFQRNVGNYKSALSGLKMGWLGVIGAIGGGIAIIRGAITAITDFVNAYNEGVLLETKLTTILKQRTGASEATIKSIIDLTKVQQDLGVVEQETQIAGLQQLSTFVKSTDSVKTLLPALNNLLVQQNELNATTIDAVSIANLFGKAMEGNAGALRRVGITFTESQEKILKFGTETERASILAQVITDNIGEMNEAFAKTDAGKIQQTKNKLGDLKEEIGGQLLPVLARFYDLLFNSLNAVKNLGEKFLNLIDPMRDVRDAQDLFADAMAEATVQIEMQKNKLDTLLKVAFDEANSLETRTQAIEELNRINPEYLGGLNAQTSSYEEAKIAVDNYIKSLEKQIYTEIASTKTKEIMLRQFEVEKELYEKKIELVDAESKVSQSLSNVNVSRTGAVNFFAPSVNAVSVQNRVNALEKEKIELQKALDDFNKFMKDTYDIDLSESSIIGGVVGGDVSGGGLNKSVQNIDIYAQKVEEINKQTLEKRRELKSEYKDDDKKIEEEILKFQQLKQLELLQFIDDNKLTDKKIADELKYIEFSEKIKQNDIANEKENTAKKLQLFNEYLELKKLGFEKENLISENSGVDLQQIELRKLDQRKEILLEQQKFVKENGTEKELLQIENDLIRLELDYKKFASNLKEIAKEDENWLLKFLGLTPEQLELYKNQLLQVYNVVSDVIQMTFDAKIKNYEDEINLIDQQIEAENKRVEELNSSLDKENELREQNKENNALLIESQIRASEELIKQKEFEQAKQIALKEEEERKLKNIQKMQIYTQFVIDNASAISSIIKYAMANPLNAPTSGLAGVGQIALLTALVTANFVKAQASIKMLKEGEVGINEGSGTKDDVPALLMRGESVITQKGTKTAPSLLKGLNKGATANELINLLYKDLGLNSLQNFVVNLHSQPYEIVNQNKELLQQNEILKNSNSALNQLIELEKNKAVYIPMKNGYKKITNNKVEIINFS